jgi:transcriptional regulator with XRE-family HTH domain
MTTLRFRNIDATPDDPVDEWGFEGILTAVERGQLPEWRRIVSTVRRDPHGKVAQELDEALDVAEREGVVDSLRRNLERARAGEAGAVAESVQRAVLRSDLTAAAFAREIGTSPSRLSTYMSGKVTPSAALLLRIERTANELALESYVRAVEARHADRPLNS